MNLKLCVLEFYRPWKIFEFISKMWNPIEPLKKDQSRLQAQVHVNNACQKTIRGTYGRRRFNSHVTE